MDFIHRVLDNDEVISFDTLTHLGRKSLREAFQQDCLAATTENVHVLWQRLQQTACSPIVVDKHLSAACNAVSEYGYSEQLWFQVFEVVHRAFNDGKIKPALQVLETLVEILQANPSQSSAQAILQKAIEEMVNVVFTGQPALRLKEACTTLSCFVRKAQNVVPVAQYFQSCGTHLESVFEQRCQRAHITALPRSNQSAEMLGNFLLALLLSASIPEARTIAIKLFSLLCSKTEKFDFQQNIGLASSAIEMYLQADAEALKDFSADVFPAVLNDVDQFSKFAKHFNPKSEFSVSRLSLFLAVLQVGRQKGFIIEAELPNLIDDALYDSMVRMHQSTTEFKGFKCILMCDVPMVRLQAFNLLTFSNALTMPVPEISLECMIQCLKYLHDESDPFYRDEYISICRRLTTRIQRSGHIILRTGTATSSHSTPNPLSSYTTFLQQWIEFLYLELLPHISYQRHILALQSLSLITPLLRVSNEDVRSIELERALILALLNLMFDAFEDVRSQAASLLIQMTSQNTDLLASYLKELNLVERSKRLSASTNRADHADALGKLIMLTAHAVHKSSAEFSHEDTQGHDPLRSVLVSVEQYLCSKASLSPSSPFPLHGSLLGISYMLQMPNKTNRRLSEGDLLRCYEVCSRIWMLVQKDLCVDSPEKETEGDENGGVEGPKDLLAYSWRALRDSSLIMQALLETQTPQDSLYSFVGSLCFEELTMLRHRGAFSTVAQTFTLCCQMCRSANQFTGQGLTVSWLEAAFEEIEQQSAKLTRRSAGLPSMFAALLDPMDSRQFLAGVERLVHIAQEQPDTRDGAIDAETRLPQVHALNCLKDVMTNSRFRLITESLVVELLNLSAQSLASKIWAIRNCGLMLFRACINRLTLDSSNIYGFSTGGLGGKKVKTPLAVAMELLDGGQNPTNGFPRAVPTIENSRSETIFAALDLLGRIPSQPAFYGTLKDILTGQFSNQLWAVREHAARLLASIQPSNEGYDDLLHEGFSSLSLSHNTQHGWILCVRNYFETHWPSWTSIEKSTRVQAFLSVLDDFSPVVAAGDLHPLGFAVVLELLNSILASTPTSRFDIVPALECSKVLQDVSKRNKLYQSFFLLRRALCLNYVLARVLAAHHDFSSDIAIGSSDQCLQELIRERDVALYTINELSQDLITMYPLLILNILQHFVSICNEPEVTAAVWFKMANCISLLNPKDIDLDSAQFVNTIDLLNAHNRDVWNAHLRVTAASARLSFERASSSDLHLLHNLITALRTSQQDEIEMPTRLCAVEAVADLLEAVFRKSAKPSTTLGSCQLRLLLLLYDFLNDDEEEIRAVATVAVSSLLRRKSELSQTVIQCAAAARKATVDFVSVTFRQDTNLIISACMRVIGAAARSGHSEIECVVTFCHTYHVGGTLSDILRSMNDLFAEERQNLYIDAVAEIETWENVIRTNGLVALVPAAYDELLSWTADGLNQLLEIFKDEANSYCLQTDSRESYTNEIVHPLGLTHNADIMTLTIRVLAMAALLRSTIVRSNTNETHAAATKDRLGKLLRDFRDICISSKVHARILAVFEFEPRN